MRILGIESSCDETAAAVVDDGRLVRSSVVASQIPVHERFGGVVPEIASRQHILAIDSIVDRALEEAGMSVGELDAVAAAFGPGLSGPLLVGTSFAKGFSLAANIPLLAVDHIEAHILSVWLAFDKPLPDPPELPLVALVASGGHTELVLVERPGHYRLLGRTIDDAAGEAFDKVGRLLGLPYPGGPNLEAAAKGARDKNLVMPRAWLPGTSDFSFSGLKTAMSRAMRDASLPPLDGEEGDDARAAELAWAFQDSVADVLSRKLAQAVRDTEAMSAAVVGGVANNEYIREMTRNRLDVSLHTPAPGLSSDNAAMIAAAAFWNPKLVGLDHDIDPNLALDDSPPPMTLDNLIT